MAKSKQENKGTASAHVISCTSGAGFQAAIKDNPSWQVAIVLANDQVRLARATELIKKSVASLSFQFERLRCSELSGAKLRELVASAANLGLFSQGKLFVIDGLQDLSATALPELARVLAGGCSSLRFLLKGTLKVNSSILNELLSSIPQGACVVNLQLDDLEAEEVIRWSARELAGHQYEVDIPAAVAHCAQNDLDRIASYCEMLKLYCADEPITIRAVNQLFRTHNELRDFELLESAVAGNAARTEMLLDRMIRDGKSPFMILGMIARSYQQLFLISTWRGDSKALGSALGLPPWLLQKQLGLAKRYTRERLNALQQEIVLADSLLKNHSIGAQGVIGILCQKLNPASLI